MADKKIVGIEISELDRMSKESPRSVVKDFFEKNKGRAFRGAELEAFFEDKQSKTLTRSAISRLHKEGLIGKQAINNKRVFYFLNEKKPNKE